MIRLNTLSDISITICSIFFHKPLQGIIQGMNIDKIALYTPIVIFILLFLSLLIVEFIGCNWTSLFENGAVLFTPGVKVLG